MQEYAKKFSEIFVRLSAKTSKMSNYFFKYFFPAQPDLCFNKKKHPF